VRQLDLGGAVVRDDLVLGGLYGQGSERWLRWTGACSAPDGSKLYREQQPPCLNLRNARVGNLQDDERAWPASITLEGCTYTYLGGIGGDQHQDMRNRPTTWWREWLSRDPIYSAQPYAQLASVLASGGWQSRWSRGHPVLWPRSRAL
jgi:hypothetical protein